MSRDDDAVQEFLTIYKKISSYYKNIRITSACLRDDDGKWHNLATSVFINFDEGENKTKIFPNEKRFRIIQTDRKISSIKSILKDIMNKKELDLGGQKILFRKQRDDRYSLSFDIHDSNWTKKKIGERIGSFFLKGTGDASTNFVDHDQQKEIDNDLKMSKKPFYGVSDAISKLLPIHELPQNNYSFFYMGSVFPLWFEKGNCNILTKQINIQITHHHKVKPVKVRIGFIRDPIEKVGSYGYSFYLSDKRLKKTKKKVEGLWINSTIILPRKNSVVVRSFLSHNELLIDELHLTIPSDELSLKHEAIIHTQFDNDYELLSKYITGKGRDHANNFERGICWLMNLQGLHTLYYGETKSLQNEIDLVAFSKDYEYVFPIECTVGPINNKEKILKLVARSKKMMENLKSKYPDIIIQPLIATCFKWDEIVNSDMQIAGRERIGILCSEFIDGLFKSSKYFYSAENLYEYFLKLIPETGKDPGDYRKGFHK